MAKKKGAAAAASKAASKAAKKAKATHKVEKKEKKKKIQNDSDVESDDDLEGILDKMRREWEEAHAVTEETVEGPPSRRANATLTTCPNGNHLWCVGGEFFSEEGKAHFYNDVYRYAPDKDEWRKFTSPTCPGPRSAHAVVGSPVGGGKLFLFGGEFSSLHQTTFHHYRDFWCFDISTHSWDRIETKIKPTARSGCRMALWKHFVVLFGGFYDPGIRTSYLNDLWLFDTQEYLWKQVELRDTERRPSPRSGFSFLPVTDGVVLHGSSRFAHSRTFAKGLIKYALVRCCTLAGGYCKEYAKGKRAIGIALEDTWLLKMDTDPKLIKWERRKKTGYAPSLRSGCTMSLWAAKNMGVLFGGVFDEDQGEEGMESHFYNDLYGYQMTGNGRWVSMTLRKPKRPKEAPQRKKLSRTPIIHEDSENEGGEGEDMDEDEDGDGDRKQSAQRNIPPPNAPRTTVMTADGEEVDADDPSLTVPLVRYNAMLAVLRNTLYVYGGIFESQSREYTLDDFYSLQLDKMDRFLCLKKSEVVIGDDESSSEDDDESQDNEDEDREGTDDESEDGENGSQIETEDDETAVAELEPRPEVDKDELRKLATAFMGVSKDTNPRSEEEALSTPLPGETLATFYSRSRQYWAQKALGISDNRGKMLRRDGFSLAEEKYASYKPILEEVQKILTEAGLDAEEMKRVGGSSKAGDSGNRNRR